MAKTVIKTIRLSEDVADMIDRQAGTTWTDRFENLVTRAYWELPSKEAELEKVKKEIESKKNELKKLSYIAVDMSRKLKNIAYFLDKFETE